VVEVVVVEQTLQILLELQPLVEVLVQRVQLPQLPELQTQVAVEVEMVLAFLVAMVAQVLLSSNTQTLAQSLWELV
jgi:C4-dicarboxylate transporter